MYIPLLPNVTKGLSHILTHELSGQFKLIMK